MIVFGIILIELWPTEFPVWALFLSLAICTYSLIVDKMLLMVLSLPDIAFFYVVPIGMIQAITNQQIGLKYVCRTTSLTCLMIYSVITELIIGYALPGRPIAMMMFKTWGYITMAQGTRCL